MNILDNDLNTITDIIKRKARKLGRRPVADSDDDTQDLFVAVLKAWPQFDPTRGSVAGFVARVVEREMISLARKANAVKRGAGRTASLDSAAANAKSSNDGYCELPEARGGRDEFELVALRLDLASALAGLSAELRATCEHLLTRTKSEIARDGGRSRTAIYGAIARIRALLIERGMQEYS